MHFFHNFCANYEVSVGLKIVLIFLLIFLPHFWGIFSFLCLEKLEPVRALSSEYTVQSELEIPKSSITESEFQM